MSSRGLLAILVTLFRRVTGLSFRCLKKRMMNTVYRKLRPICQVPKVYCSVASPFGMDEAERHSSNRGMIVHVHVKLSNCETMHYSSIYRDEM